MYWFEKQKPIFEFEPYFVFEERGKGMSMYRMSKKCMEEHKR